MSSIASLLLFSLMLSLAAGCGAPLPGEPLDEVQGTPDTAQPLGAVAQPLSGDSLRFNEYPCSGLGPLACTGWSGFVNTGESKCEDSDDCMQEYNCKRCRVPCVSGSQSYLPMCWDQCCDYRPGPQTLIHQINFQHCWNADGRTCRQDDERWIPLHCGC